MRENAPRHTKVPLPLPLHTLPHIQDGSLQIGADSTAFTAALPRTLMRYDDNRNDIAGEMARTVSELV